MIKYLNGTKKNYLTLSADYFKVTIQYVDASFVVHSDFKSHAVAIMTMGQVATYSVSRKQEMDTRSSTEAELVAVDYA